MFKKIQPLIILLLLLTAIVPAAQACSPDKVDMPIVLLTDFGSDDYRVARLKGIILSNNPEARMIDATHGIPAFDIYAGAYILDVAVKEFPGKVVFTGIVAPYDQTEVKYLVITTDKKQFLILPDNGLITYVLENQNIRSIYHINNTDLFDDPLDELNAEQIQGKTAALIASGYEPENCGSRFSKPAKLDIQKPQLEGQKILGTVVFIDHYGNCVTNIPGDMVSEAGIMAGNTVSIVFNEKEIAARFGEVYSDVPQGDPIVLINRNLGNLQLSINLGNFAEKHGIDEGTRIEIEQ